MSKQNVNYTKTTLNTQTTDNNRAAYERNWLGSVAYRWGGQSLGTQVQGPEFQAKNRNNFPVTVKK